MKVNSVSIAQHSVINVGIYFSVHHPLHTFGRDFGRWNSLPQD